MAAVRRVRRSRPTPVPGHPARRLTWALAVVAVLVVATSLLTRWLAHRRELATPGIEPP